MSFKRKLSSIARIKTAEQGGNIDAEIAREIIDTLPVFMHWFRNEMRLLAEPELTIAQLRILTKVHQASRTMSELAEIQGVSAPAISRMVSILERRDLAERVHIGGDRRCVALRLTQKGQSMCLSIQGQVQRRIENRIAELRPSKKRRMFIVLQYFREFSEKY